MLQSGADDPKHYLRRNYDHAWRMAGSLFFQFDCTPQSRNLVIYGHNMNDGSMFGVLEEMLDADFLQEHTALTLETPEGTRNYEIVTAMKTDITRIPFNRVDFAADEDFLAFADQLHQTGGYTADKEDCLLTLVTCAYDWEGARTVVVAVETEQAEKHFTAQSQRAASFKRKDAALFAACMEKETGRIDKSQHKTLFMFQLVL